MARSVYLETSIISYLVARPSRDLVTAARQELTREWWARRRRAFNVYVSEAVVAEARAGDPEAAARRAEILAPRQLLDITPDITRLAQAVADALQLPGRAAADAVHIAAAACHGIDFLLTWNSTHIANAELRPTVERACRDGGYFPPILCTPDELMGD
ncbi:type II toxin-antitoxin system VapC family toxin [Candidatus Binatia bacterium]|nr:type II toxin-antitoxin system VapC family toxin [Candidatus Binatia bacterium]